MEERIGFVGVGRMGSRMAGNLLDAGYEVTVFDVDSARIEEMEAAGARAAESAATVAEASDVVMTSLPDSAIVEAVYFGEDGLVDSAAPGSLLVEMSTVLPETVEEIADAAAGSDVGVVDCPVIGTPPEAAEATLTIVVGCDDGTYERVQPFLDHLGNRIEHVGEPGVAKRVKLANNVMTYGNFAIAAEMIALVERLDIDPERFFEITDSGAAGSAIARSKVPKAFEGDFDPGFTIDGACKDLRYGLRMKEDVDHPAPIAAAIAEQYTLAAAEGEGASDYSVLVDVFNRAIDR